MSPFSRRICRVCTWFAPGQYSLPALQLRLHLGSDLNYSQWRSAARLPDSQPDSGPKATAETAGAAVDDSAPVSLQLPHVPAGDEHACLEQHAAPGAAAAGGGEAWYANLPDLSRSTVLSRPEAPAQPRRSRKRRLARVAAPHDRIPPSQPELHFGMAAPGPEGSTQGGTSSTQGSSPLGSGSGSAAGGRAPDSTARQQPAPVTAAALAYAARPLSPQPGQPHASAEAAARSRPGRLTEPVGMATAQLRTVCPAPQQAAGRQGPSAAAAGDSGGAASSSHPVPAPNNADAAPAAGAAQQAVPAAAAAAAQPSPQPQAPAAVGTTEARPPSPRVAEAAARARAGVPLPEQAADGAAEEVTTWRGLISGLSFTDALNAPESPPAPARPAAQQAPAAATALPAAAAQTLAVAVRAVDSAADVQPIPSQQPAGPGTGLNTPASARAAAPAQAAPSCAAPPAAVPPTMRHAMPAHQQQPVRPHVLQAAGVAIQNSRAVQPAPSPHAVPAQPQHAPSRSAPTAAPAVRLAEQMQHDLLQQQDDTPTWSAPEQPASRMQQHRAAPTGVIPPALPAHSAQPIQRQQQHAVPARRPAPAAPEEQARPAKRQKSAGGEGWWNLAMPVMVDMALSACGAKAPPPVAQARLAPLLVALPCN